VVLLENKERAMRALAALSRFVGNTFALFSVCYNISGALLSTYFRCMSEKADRATAARAATD
jgi:BASS family bile acid:Na+ symporter